MSRRLSPWLRRALLGLGLTLAATWSSLGGEGLALTESVDRLIYDARLQAVEAAPSDRVVIVDIDERSLAEQGRWPWSRGVLADLAGRLVDRGQVAVVAFDVLFAEAEADGVQDRRLAQVLSGSPAVLGYYFSSDRGGQTTGSLPGAVLQAASIEELGLAITDWNGYGANLPAMQAAARRVGFFNPIIDPDGVVRRLPLLGRHQDQIYESFALAILRTYLGAPPLRLDAERLILAGPRGRIDLPLSEGLSALVPFGRPPEGVRADAGHPPAVSVPSSGDSPASPTALGAAATGLTGRAVGERPEPGEQQAQADQDTAGARKGATRAAVAAAVAAAGAGMHPGSGRFLNVSATDVLEDRVDWARLKGRIVLIGTSAPGLSDLRATPISRTLPGVEVHAALVDAALRDLRAPPAGGTIAGDLDGTGAAGPIRQRPVGTALIDAVAVGLVGTVLALAMPAVGALGTLALAAVGLGALAAWNELAWSGFGWSLPVATGLLLVLGLGVMNLGFGHLLEGRARRAVAHLFGAYVSPDLVDQMTRNPARFARMSSENRELTIMFTDIRGFTRIAESMEPTDLREYINDFLTAMTEVIHRHHGTVDKYIGDAVMAFWGAPLEDPAHADQAVAAAYAMLDEVERLNRVNARRGRPPLVIGIGINTGIACVGDMGSRLRRAYTVLGDAVNLASRIESLTKQFGAPVIVGETTARRATGHEFRELAQVSVTGRTEQVRIYVPRIGDEAPIPGQILSCLTRPEAAAQIGAELVDGAGPEGREGGQDVMRARPGERHEAARTGL